jgi:hypothetical protein
MRSRARRGSSWGQEAEDRGEEGGGVERVGVVVLAQDASPVDAVLEDVVLDLVGDPAPRRDEPVIGAQLRELRRAVHRDPAHGLPRQIEALDIPVTVIPTDPTGWSYAHRFPDSWVRTEIGPLT